VHLRILGCEGGRKDREEGVKKNKILSVAKRKLPSAKAILENKNRLALPDSKAHYKAMAIKAVWYWNEKSCESME
jgi:hypothetical protein